MTRTWSLLPFEPQQPETKRFNQLLPFFHRTGCCFVCAMDFAIAVVEKEGGRPYATGDCVHADRDRLRCKERARLAWKALPPKDGP